MENPTLDFTLTRWYDLYSIDATPYYIAKLSYDHPNHPYNGNVVIECEYLTLGYHIYDLHGVLEDNNCVNEDMNSPCDKIMNGGKYDDILAYTLYEKDGFKKTLQLVTD